MASSQAPVLTLAQLNKRFGGTHAVRNVGFSLAAGEIVALLGENGAGKSTLIKMLAGVHAADSGRFLFRGAAFDPRDGHAGIAFIHQDLGLIEWMTVAENICLMRGNYPRRFGLIDWRQSSKAARAALAIVSADIDPETRVRDLTRTEKSLVAIARALVHDVQLIVLDEPTASLPQADVEILHKVLRSLRARGVAIIYVSHRLDEVFAIADRAVVLRDGYLVADEPIAGLDGERLVELIIGGMAKDVFVRPPRPQGTEVVLRVDGLVVQDVGPVSFALHRGEVLGLVGLRGAGQEAVGRALFGRASIGAGEVHLRGGPAIDCRNPLEAIRAGIVMVAGDRYEESVARGLTVAENLFLNPSLTGRRIVDFAAPEAEAAKAAQIGRTFDIRPNDPSAPIETLSGGNQQKVVIARWMQLDADVLILEDPTAGVDVGSKAEIYALLAKALEDGLAVLLISTDFEEVAALSHRACVFRNGSITTELESERLSVETLLSAASLETTTRQEYA